MKRFRLIKLAGYSLVLIFFLVILANPLLAAGNEAAKAKKRVRDYCIINQGLVKKLRQLLKQRIDLMAEWVEAVDQEVESIKDEYEKAENKMKKSFLPKGQEETDKQFNPKLKEQWIRLVSLEERGKNTREIFSN